VGKRSLKSLKVVPYLGTVSYSPSIVTMAVSAAISQIFSVKEWPDLEIWVWGLSRSLRLASIDHASYLTLNNTATLKCGLEVTQGH